MKTNLPEQGVLTENSTGSETDLRDLVEKCGSALALISGHEARTVPRAAPPPNEAMPVPPARTSTDR